MKYIDENKSNLSATVAAYKDSELLKYDNSIVYGSEVIKAVSYYKELCIIVKYPLDSSKCMAFNRGITDSCWNTDGKYRSAILPETAIISDMYSSLTVSNMADKENYINPTAKFRANLITQNEDVIGLTFSHES